MLSACRVPLLLQGLSDFRMAELPGLGGMLDDRCPLYLLKKDDSAPGGEGRSQQLTASRHGMRPSADTAASHRSTASNLG